jgi:hypothetical protein
MPKTNKNLIKELTLYLYKKSKLKRINATVRKLEADIKRTECNLNNELNKLDQNDLDIIYTEAKKEHNKDIKHIKKHKKHKTWFDFFYY